MMNNEIVYCLLSGFCYLPLKNAGFCLGVHYFRCESVQTFGDLFSSSVRVDLE